jgi:hypothetical protein
LLSKAGRAAIPLPSNQASMQLAEDWPNASCESDEVSKASEDNATGCSQPAFQEAPTPHQTLQAKPVPAICSSAVV